MDTINLDRQADAVLYFLEGLDIEMLNAVLEDNRRYQDFEKHVFSPPSKSRLQLFLKKIQKRATILKLKFLIKKQVLYSSGSSFV